MRTFELDKSPFAVLAVSPRANLAAIEDAFEDTLIDRPEAEALLLKAKQTLLTPNARLVEELAWPTDAAPSRVDALLEKLRGGKASDVAAAVADLPPLAAANVAADAAERFGDSAFVDAISASHDELVPDALAATLNAVRSAAGFPAVTVDQVGAGLVALRERHAAAAMAAVLAQPNPAGALAALLLGPLSKPDAVFVPALMRAYDHWSLPHLSVLEDEIGQGCEQMLAGADGAVAELCEKLEAWDALSQPAQVHASHAGLDEVRSLRIYRRVRGTCVDIANDQNRFDDARQVAERMRKLFVELPTARAELDRDLEALLRLTAEASLGPLLDVVAEAGREAKTFAAEVITHGFHASSTGARSRRLWQALCEADVALGPDDRTDAALVAVRGLALDLNNDHQAGRAALILLEGASKAAPARVAANAERVQSDIAILRRSLEDDRLGTALSAKKFGEAIRIIDGLLASEPDAEARNKLTLAREHVSRAQIRRVFGWAFWAVVGLVILAVVLDDGASSDFDPPVASGLEAEAPSADTAAAAAAAAAADAAAAAVEPAVPATEPETDEVSRPPAGTDVELSVSQLRYCRFEKIRMTALQAQISDDADTALVDRFNARVDDYNARCGSFRYQPSDLERVERDAEAARVRLEAEAADLLREWTP